MVRARSSLLIALAGCGRLAFSPSSASDASGDGTGGGDVMSDFAVDAIDDCARPGVLLCDHFETGLGLWTINGAVAQTQIVHGGTTAAQVATDTAQTPATLNANNALGGLAAGSLHGRAWFYIPTTLTLTKVNMFGLDGPAGTDGATFLVDTGTMAVYNASDGATVTTGVAPPRNQWFCVEMHIQISNGNGTLTVDVDGTQIGMMSTLDTLPGSGYVRAAIGMSFLTAPSGPGSIYFDDLVIGTQPVGC